MSSGTHSASCAMPALPGAHQSFVVSGEAAIFQASACSRPPEPRRRMFMAADVARFGGGFATPRRSVDRRLRARRQRVRIDLDQAVAQPHAVGREPLGEGRRRAAVLEPVLVAVPRAGDAAVDDAAFAERAVLVRAEVRQRADLVAVTEHRDALAVRRRDDARGLVRDRIRRADREPAVMLLRCLALAPGGRDMQRASPARTIRRAAAG